MDHQRQPDDANFLRRRSSNDALLPVSGGRVLLHSACQHWMNSPSEEVRSIASITDIADKFFVAVDTGKGCDACKAYCAPAAIFAAQAEPLADVKTLEQYCNWMKGLLGKSFSHGSEGV